VTAGTNDKSGAAGLMAISEGIASSLRRLWQQDDVAITGLRRLTGGASSQTYAFSARRPNGETQVLILRRDPFADAAGAPQQAETRYGPGWDGEFQVLRAAAEGGVPVPEALIALTPADGIGQGFIMGFVEGETVARKILRDAEYAAARDTMAAQCGTILGRIHTLKLDCAPGLKHVSTRAHIAHYRERLSQWPEPMPALEFGLRWVEQRCPSDATEVVRFVHGDFRHGNLIVGPEGVRAVLDWEVAHLGDPYEDLGWICTKAWRFGGPKPVGGFGEREDLHAAYAAATGQPVDRERARFWEIFGSLRWGIMCLGLTERHLSGRVRSLEFAAIGRRVSENEHDLLALIEGEI
jgi:aminoglycoside phosphotransferase (APT) family kinase protein